MEAHSAYMGVSKPLKPNTMKLNKLMKKYLYVTNTDSNDISVVDIESRKEISRISVGESPRGSVRFDKEQKFGYVSNCAGNTISVIDLNSNTEIAKIKVGLSPRGIFISEDGTTAYVSNSGSNNLSVVDLLKRVEIQKIAMAGNPRHMGLLKGNRLLVCEWGADSIASIDINEDMKVNRHQKSIGVGRNSRPYSLNIATNSNKAFVANTQANYMSVIDLTTNKETDRIEVGYGGRAIAISQDEKYAYTTVENTNEVVVVDLMSNEVVHRISVGPSPRGIAIDFDRNEIYSSNFTRCTSEVGSRNSISIVDISSALDAKMIDEVIVGLGPCSVSILNKEI